MCFTHSEECRWSTGCSVLAEDQLSVMWERMSSVSTSSVGHGKPKTYQNVQLLEKVPNTASDLCGGGGTMARGEQWSAERKTHGHVQCLGFLGVTVVLETKRCV